MNVRHTTENQVDQRETHRRQRILQTGAIVIAMTFAASSNALTAYAGTDAPSSLVFVAAPALPPQTLHWTPPATYVSPVVARDGFTATTPEELAARNAAAAAAAAAALAETNRAAAAAASSVPASTRSQAVFAPPQAGYSGAAVLAYAEQFVGVVPYGRGANPADSFMCDGLTQWVFGQYGIALPRTVTAQQLMGTRISQADARAGDLVVWPSEHVGIYDGAGGVIHAPDWGHYVEHKTSLWGNPIFIRL